jgi:hypothetical protein
MNNRVAYPVGRGDRMRFKERSLSPKRVAYIDAGEPHGRNRKGLKRWLRERKAAGGRTAYLRARDGRDFFYFVCEGCGSKGEIGVPLELGMQTFECPEECGAVYVRWNNPVTGKPDLMCVVRPVFVETGELPEFDDDDYVDDDDGDDFDDDECGMTADGGCTLAGTEFCDWDCPYGS